LQLIEHLSNFSDLELKRCQNLLDNNFIPYNDIGEDNPDEELVWCTVKNSHLRADPKFKLTQSTNIFILLLIGSISTAKHCRIAIVIKRLPTSAAKWKNVFN